MNILTGIVVSVLLMSLLLLWAYSKNHIAKKSEEIIVDVCAALLGVSIPFGVLIIGHWTAVLLGRL